MRDPGTAGHPTPRIPATVAEVREHVLRSVQRVGTQTVGLTDALGRVLAEEIRADRSIPPLPNSAMDGFAARSADVQQLAARLRVVATVPAGPARELKLEPGQAARIFTGAPIPDGADTVVMQEHTERDGDVVVILRGGQAGDHIRDAGSDVAAGSLVFAEGELLQPASIGMLAALGRTQVRVGGRPRVAVLATGDELVEPDRLGHDGRIASSNSYSLCAALADAGCEPYYMGIIPDAPAVLRAAFEQALRCDAVISTGGVSVGDYDWIRQILAELGGDMRLWRVDMKPGAPLAFVQAGRTSLFGLPGNPVSTLVTFEQFVRPALLRMAGRRAIFRPVETALLASDYAKPAGRTHFVRVRIETHDGVQHARIAGDQSSGVLIAMVRADGLAIAPKDETLLRAGTPIAVQRVHRTDLREEPGF